jgi:hypothetical protein
VVGAGAFFSYGLPLLAGIAGLAALRMGRPPRADAARAVLAAGAAAAALFLAPLAAGHAPLRSMAQGLAIHREAFTTPRDHLLWAAWNPLDVAVFLGPAALLLIAAATGESASRLARTLGALVLLLLASGAVRGEAGRIALPLMPALLVAGSVRWCADAPRAALLGALLGMTALGLRLSWRLP